MTQLRKKVIEDSDGGISPITLASTVYVETNKTLAEAIEDGSIGSGSQSGGGTLANGRGHTLLTLRGGIIHIRKSGTTITYSFPTLDTDRYRRMFVWKATGERTSKDIPDGQLLDNEALVYDVSTNTLATKLGTWGNVVVSTNEVILLYNNLGNLSGALLPFCKFGEGNKAAIIKDVVATEISTTGSTQGIFIIGNELYRCAHSNDAHTDTANIGVYNKTTMTLTRNVSHNLGHMNSPDYQTSTDLLLVGNGSKDYALELKAWIIPNASTVFGGTSVDFNTITKIELDFTSLSGSKCNVCWGALGSDIIYMCVDDVKKIYKIKLNKTGATYDGTWSLLGTLTNDTSDILGGMLFVNGELLIGVKGTHGIRKVVLYDDGTFGSEYRSIVNKTGDMQGLAFSGTTLYAFTDFKGYTVVL